jgi:2',3'-cyclic-nucleotide 2'-phosphodiesterase (5'-nucleotidase family)
MASKFIVLHTNDIHGRIEGLSRIVTLIEQIRAENPTTPVLYFDAGDSEDYSIRLCNLTNGTVMHRLLNFAECAAVVPGNAYITRLGPQVLEDHAAISRYPHLLANLITAEGSPIPGTQPSVLVAVEGLRFGVIGVTADDITGYDVFWKLHGLPLIPRIKELAVDLRRNGAGAVIVLSHLGLKRDQQIAEELQDHVDIIIGAHSHTLLPEGERVGNILIAQAGQYAEHLGQIDLTWNGGQIQVDRAFMLPITDTIPLSESVQAEIHTVEGEIQRYLDEILGELAEPLDFAIDRECRVGNFVADILRYRMNAELSVVAVGPTISAPLEAGSLRRGTLWESCISTANPGVVDLTGAQLMTLVQRGQDREWAQDQPRGLRGARRGLIHLSGAVLRDGSLWIGDHPVEAERVYRVAGTDLEFESDWGYVDAEWGVHAEYELPTILREVVQDYLKQSTAPIYVTMGRLH